MTGTRSTRRGRKRLLRDMRNWQTRGRERVLDTALPDALPAPWWPQAHRQARRERAGAGDEAPARWHARRSPAAWRWQKLLDEGGVHAGQRDRGGGGDREELHQRAGRSSASISVVKRQVLDSLDLTLDRRHADLAALTDVLKRPRFREVDPGPPA